MTSDFEKFAARAAPAIFVVLWSTGFIGTKYVLNSAEPLTYLAIRMACVVVFHLEDSLHSQLAERIGPKPVGGLSRKPDDTARSQKR